VTMLAISVSVSVRWRTLFSSSIGTCAIGLWGSASHSTAYENIRLRSATSRFSVAFDGGFLRRVFSPNRFVRYLSTSARPSLHRLPIAQVTEDVRCASPVRLVVRCHAW
jgi:hypothetical protein